MSYELPQKFNGPYRPEVASSQQISNPDLDPSHDEIQFQFPQQNMNQMHKFDIHQIYSNKDIAEVNKYRSDFIFLIKIIQRGSRHLIAIEKSQVIWTVLKLVILSVICYFLNSWIGKLQNINPFIQTTLLYIIRILPPLLLIVMSLDPGSVLDHEIYQNEYQSTDDKRRPKDGKYCEQCKLFVKRRTGHCYKCNHCVSNFDHHCGIMARCVGRPNAVPFYAFALLANFIYMGSVMLLVYEWVFV